MVYDLEQRTFAFAENVRRFAKQIPRTIGNLEDIKQLIRSTGSVGANYIEANEALSKRDFLMRLRIARKEAKESAYWLKLLDTDNAPELVAEREALATEAVELMKIIGAILRKSE